MSGGKADDDMNAPGPNRTGPADPSPPAEHGPARAFLGFGSNVRPYENVPDALRLLAETPFVTIAGISTILRTRALPNPQEEGDPTNVGTARKTEAPVDMPALDFLNGVVEIHTELTVESLMRVLQQVEEALGRKRTEDKFAPRTMDLDLLLFSPLAHAAEGLVWAEIGVVGRFIHPDVLSRSFVALPLMELAPNLLLPPDGTPLTELAAAFSDPEGVHERALTADLRSRFLPT